MAFRLGGPTPGFRDRGIFDLDADFGNLLPQFLTPAGWARRNIGRADQNLKIVIAV